MVPCEPSTTSTTDILFNNAACTRVQQLTFIFWPHPGKSHCNSSGVYSSPSWCRGKHTKLPTTEYMYRGTGTCAATLATIDIRRMTCLEAATASNNCQAMVYTHIYIYTHSCLLFILLSEAFFYCDIRYTGCVQV